VRRYLVSPLTGFEGSVTINQCDDGNFPLIVGLIRYGVVYVGQGWVVLVAEYSSCVIVGFHSATKSRVCRAFVARHVARVTRDTRATHARHTRDMTRDMTRDKRATNARQTRDMTRDMSRVCRACVARVSRVCRAAHARHNLGQSSIVKLVAK